MDRTAEAVEELRRADVIVVLDISDLGRLGMLGETVADARCAGGLHRPPRERGSPAGRAPLRGSRARRPPASWSSRSPWPTAGRSPRRPRAALYVAILTDTGGFRFSNTRPRTLRVAAELLETGVDPEEIYLEVYARAPEGRPRLFAEALQTLVVEPEYGLAWVTVPPGAMERLGRLARTTSRASWSSPARSRGCGWRSSSAR